MRERNTLTAAQRLEQRQQRKSKPAKNYYQLEKYKALRYNYAEIKEEHRELVQAAAVEIRGRLKRTVEDMIAIGKYLEAVKDYFPHGEYHKWLKAEFGISIGNASEHRSVAARFDGKVSIIESLTPTTARLLAPISVPDAVIDAVVKAAHEKGSPLPVTEVRAIRNAIQPPQPKQLTGPAPDFDALPAEVGWHTVQRGGQTSKEPDTIDAEYTVIQSDTDLLQLGMTRSMVRKMHVAVVRNNRIWEVFTGEELDRLNIILSNALKAE